MDGLNGLQLAINAGIVQLSQCAVDPDLKVLLDHPNNTPRFSEPPKPCKDGFSGEPAFQYVQTVPVHARSKARS
jgi:hypothetical protein